MHPLLRSFLRTGLASLLMVTGCATMVDVPAIRPNMVLPTVPQGLSQPQGFDWSTQRVTSRQVEAGRVAHTQATMPAAEADRRLLAFPTRGTGWNTGAGGGAVDGVPLANLGALIVGDNVPNGPATAFYGGTVPNTLWGKIFFLTRKGLFIRTSKTAPTIAGSKDVLLGGGFKDFSRTFVSLSPSCTRAYLLADDGTFYVVNTVTMQVMATVDPANAPVTVAVNGGRGIAPFVDPYTSTYNDVEDHVYIPGNDGTVTQLRIVNTGSATSIQVADQTVHTVSTTPAAGHRFIAPAVVLAGIIYIGDQAGNFYAYNTLDPAESAGPFDLGAPICAAPTLEIQDGTYALTDEDGAPVSVALGTPIYAFVNAGLSCNWVNLYDDTVNSSLDLWIDDNDDNQDYGYLLDYGSATTSRNRTLTAVDGVTLATDGSTLPGAATFRTANWLAPALTGTFSSGGAAAGGPVVSYLRFSDPNTYNANSTITRATLTLRANQSVQCPPPRIMATSPYYQGSASTLWANGAITNAAGATQRPAIGADIGTYNGRVRRGLVNYNAGNDYRWTVTRAFSGVSVNPPAPPYYYALAMQHNPNPITHYYSGVAPTAGRYRGVPFNNYSAANGKPSLALTYTSYTRFPTGQSLHSPPVLDPNRRMAYVVNYNHVYGVNYANPTAFTDSAYDPVANTGTKYTLHNQAELGEYTNGSSGATFNNRANFVNNMSAVLMNYGASALYVANMHPNVNGAGVPTSWDTCVSKFTLPLRGTGAGNRLASSTNSVAVANMPVPWLPNANPVYQPNSASVSMVIDPYANETTTGGGVYLGLGNGRVYHFEP